MSEKLSLVQPTSNSLWGTYLQQVDRVLPYLGDLAKWAETLKRAKRALIAQGGYRIQENRSTAVSSIWTTSSRAFCLEEKKEGERVSSNW